jgi:hypothetical protein
MYMRVREGKDWMTLFQAFQRWGELLLPLAAQIQPPSESLNTQLQQTFSVLTPAHSGAVEEALIDYFDQPPTHIAAVNALDHSQFVNPLTIPGVGTLCLRSMLELFSHQGPGPYGQVWLSLLDIAEKANPNQIRAQEGRDYIQTQMSITATPPTVPPIPSAAQLDTIMGSVLNAFPGLQECIGKIVQGASTGPGGEADLNNVVDQVQNVLLGPLLQNIKSANPGAPDISEPLAQILNGFRGLNAVVSAAKSPCPAGKPDTEQEMDT